MCRVYTCITCVKHVYYFCFIHPQPFLLVLGGLYFFYLLYLLKYNVVCILSYLLCNVHAEPIRQSSHFMILLYYLCICQCDAQVYMGNPGDSDEMHLPTSGNSYMAMLTLWLMILNFVTNVGIYLGERG